MTAKGPFEQLARRVDRLAGAPRLRASLRDPETGRQVVHVLKRVSDFDPVRVTAADRGAERLFDILADDEDHPVKTGAHRIEHGVIHDGFAGRTDFVKLFETAVTAAHSGRQHEKREFHDRTPFTISMISGEYTSKYASKQVFQRKKNGG